MSNNNSRVALSLQESWASNLSDYLLLRRQQTQSAYKAPDNKTNSNDGQVDKPQDTALFSALLIMLTTHLEQGHTVLTIEEAKDEVPVQGYIGGESIALYAWQVQLLEMLAAPLLALVETQNDHSIDSEDATESSFFRLLSIIFNQRYQLWSQSVLTNYERELLTKRFDAITALYQRLKNTDLEAFIDSISDYDLFSNVQHMSEDNKNSLSKNNKPIIYQTKEEKSKLIVLWLHRTWQAEFSLAKRIHTIMNQQITPLTIAIPGSLEDQQIAAINVANHNAFSIITGGPGTGKTYTVAQLVIALQHTAQGREGENAAIKFSTDSASLALAAPTGKAAQRMQESLQAALDAANVDMQLEEAKTIHRLLGIGRTGRPRYDADNPLGEDIIIVDEASMLGVELANYLVSAVKKGARLILLGDANQLAAVDAGAVLADLCRTPCLQPINIELTESRRFSKDSGIGRLAQLINNSNTDTQAIWQLLEQDQALSFSSINTQSTEIIADNQIINSLSSEKIFKRITLNYQKYVNNIHVLLKHPIEKSMPTVVKETITSLMQTFNQFRILTAGHNGEWGDHYINNYLTQWHLTELKLPLGQNTWFHGRPVMVLQNNYELGLFNGDIGFCLQTSDDSRQLEVFFENKTQGIAVNLLNEELVATAYAMTIHKSQGSEFDHVAISFDSSHSRLLSKELIYTAVTRAKKQVTIYSTKPAFEKAVQTPTQRYTGLALQFDGL
ncbi:exodeoxyribonuclease V subunit alpha [Psychrobacter sp. 2Y5]|uniref:exodeoxyribonuclease V subunit alpha n=1 Tax=unclassified Psychrobacter TaxID=196806 RepID=UPI003F451C8D